MNHQHDVDRGTFTVEKEEGDGKRRKDQKEHQHPLGLSLCLLALVLYELGLYGSVINAETVLGDGEVFLGLRMA